MGKIAFVFPGQGAQHPGMGQELYEQFPAAKKVFDLCEQVRPGTLEQCFAGTMEALTETRNTQPCMLAVELAAAAALEELGVHADMAAGFSLGEIAALACAGAASVETAFRIVCQRAAFMQEAAEQVDSAMAAVLKLPDGQVEALCAPYAHVYPVNYNCPGQVTVAGLSEELKPFLADVKAAGGRGVPLKVRGGFHSPFMASASERLSQALAAYDLRTPAIPLYSNYTGLPYEAAELKQKLALQVCHPGRWQGSVAHMIAQGADTFIEAGPGKTLCGLIGRIDSGVRTFAVETAEELRNAVKEAAAC